MSRRTPLPCTRWRLARTSVLASAPLLLAACVTTYEDAPIVGDDLQRPTYAVPQMISLGDAPTAEDQRLLLEVYGGILQRMGEAVADRDLPQLDALLDGYERSNLPPWLKGRIAGYRAVSHGLRFQQHAVAYAALRLRAPAAVAAADAPPTVPAPAPTVAPVPPVPPLGQPIHLEFTLPASGDPVHLGGRLADDPLGFAVAVTVEDTFVDGSTRNHKTQEFAWLPDDLELAGDVVLRLPVDVDLEAAEAVQRVVHVRVDLMPGYVLSAGIRAPLQRWTSLAAISLTQWPAGYEAIARAPLATLREALRLGDQAHFRHVFLAAVFTQGADRETAIGLLIDRVRFGRQDQALVAMAALRAITDVREAVGDRDAWLAWWQVRR